MRPAAQPSIYAIIIGEEREDDRALIDTLEKLRANFPDRVVGNPLDIARDSDIYLIAHGDDTMYPNCGFVRLGNKSPKDVVEIAVKILRESGASPLDPFMGRIILEGCHTAEPIIDRDVRVVMKDELEQAMQSGDEPGVQNIGKNVARVLNVRANERHRLEASSFLVEIADRLKDYKILAPQARIGGYLGVAFAGEYKKTGYGSAESVNPATIRFQRERGIEEKRHSTGFYYPEEVSYLEIAIGVEPKFGRAGR
jgi:hypothetical protein